MIERSGRDLWPLGLFILHLGRATWFANIYPYATYDPDLLAYFVYFRNWLAGSDTIHGVSYFTVPKPLLVLGLGPIADVSIACGFSAIVSAFVGAISYMIARDTFRWEVGILLSLTLLLDADMAGMALRSSADLFVAAFVLASVWFSMQRRIFGSSLLLLLGALAKPVALPSALHFLALSDHSWKRRSLAMALPFLAVPLLAASNQLLLGSALGSTQFFDGFEAMGEGQAIGPTEVVHFVFWVQLVKRTFISTAPFGLVGIAVWLVSDRSKLTHPFFLAPILVLCGYVGLAFITDYVPFYRFFWIVQVWFTAFLIYGIWETGSRLITSTKALALALTATLMVFVFDDGIRRQILYRSKIATPFHTAMEFVSKTPRWLVSERRPTETILTPLAFLPYLMWELGPDSSFDVVLIAEEQASAPSLGRPDWILWVPEIFANRAARDRVAKLIQQGGYDVVEADKTAALLALPKSERTAPFSAGLD